MDKELDIALRHLNAGQAHLALPWLRSALARQPLAADLRVHEAWARYQLNRPGFIGRIAPAFEPARARARAAAILSIERAMESQPDCVDGLVSRGRIALEEGRLSTARGAVRRALALEPEHAGAAALAEELDGAAVEAQIGWRHRLMEMLAATYTRLRPAPQRIVPVRVRYMRTPKV